MHRISLHDAQWTIEASGEMSAAPSSVRGRAFSARVPGCVHSDLIRAGLIGHPDIEFNEEACQWIGRTDWRYRCRIAVTASILAHDRVDLVLNGLDTVGVIEVNGHRAGEAMNMHHAHRFNVKPMLRAGGNNLVITLRGPVTYVREQERRLGSRPVNGDWTPYSYIRKTASNFQWDWGPRVATCGIWRGAHLEAWNVSRISGVRPNVESADATRAVVRVSVDIERASASDDGLTLISTLGNGTNVVAHSTVERATTHGVALTLEIPQPALWQPRGRGAQTLHQLDVHLLRGEQILDQWSSRIGLRQSRLLRQPDSSGESFAIEINGIPIFCKGANWIPEGLFPEDQSPQRIRQRVQQAADANMNMLRVWGGGTFETDGFYEACDELGILVWQDFMFACATYPEDDPYPALIEREAREAVTRLAHHPSIVLWCGGNENILGYESWGWKQRMQQEQRWGEQYFLELLPRVVEELDHSRPYWADSPYSGSRAIHPNDPDRGDRHTWDAKVEEYRHTVPRFCSEFGHQSPPCWATMRKAWGEDQLRLDSRAMIHRQRATGGNDVWYGPGVMGGRFANPTDFDAWLYQSHVVQARAIVIGIEWMRANQPRCMGALFWQLNDAWAGHSWSCIDSAGRRKPLWHAVKRAFAPRMLTIQPIGGELRVCACNDRSEAWPARVRVRRMHANGETLAEHVEAIMAQPLAAAHSNPLRTTVGPQQDARCEFIVAEAIGEPVERAYWFFEHDRALALPEAALHATARTEGGDVLLTLHARSIVRDIVLAVDRVDPAADVDDNLITMLAGDSRTLRIRTAPNLPADRWIASPILDCANRHVLAR